MFEPLLEAPVAIQFHAVSAVLALAIGPVAIFRRRRDTIHKTIGYIWVLAMAVVIASSFLIFEIRVLGPFSPIHLLSLFAALNLWRGVKAAILGDIKRHQKTMRGLYFWALGLAGLFTLTPGRIMGQVLFNDYQSLGFYAVLVLAAGFFAVNTLRGQAKKTTTFPS